MLTWFISLLFILFSFLLETTCLYMYTDLSIPLSLMALIFCSLRYGNFLAQVLGFLLGCLVDVLTGSPLGFSVLSYLTVGFIVANLAKEDSLDSWLMLTTYYILARLIQVVISFSLTSFFVADPWQSYGWSQGFWLGLLINPVYIHFLNALANFFNGKKLPRITQY